ncbi:hypothetical protein D3C85_1150030 [compost metagenome]
MIVPALAMPPSWKAPPPGLRIERAPVVPAISSLARWPVITPPDRGSLVASATVIFAVPSKLTPLMVRAVASLVAVLALPVRAPVTLMV